MANLSPANDLRETLPLDSRAWLGKKIGYLWFLGPVFLPLQGWLLGMTTGWSALFAFWTVFVIYGVVPIVDHIVGEDARNPSDADVPQLESESYYRLLTLSVPLVQLANLLFCGWLFVNGVGGWVGQVGWALSAGMVSGATVITTAHELIHKQPKLERWTGSLLLSSVCYATFTPEHLYGHHRHVATPEDGSTALKDESLLHFILRAFRYNPMRGYRISAFRARKRGHSPWGWRNEMVPLTLASIAFAVIAFALAGWLGVLFFLAQSVGAIYLLEVVNYIEHYGLMRDRLPNGKYERITPQHSWNANFTFTNWLLFQLQRHSDHHANGGRRYQSLRHFDDAPQLPFGYATAIVVAHIPPLWRAIMNPRVEAHLAARRESATQQNVRRGA